MATPFGNQLDCIFMQRALCHALRAYRCGEVPIGAVVITMQGEEIGCGANDVEHSMTQLAHAELIALACAGKKNKDWRLDNCWVYVTLEPCAMCMYAMRQSRCAGVVFAASSPSYGYRLVDKTSAFQLYKEYAVEVVAGVCAEESAELLQGFFRDQRKKKREML